MAAGVGDDSSWCSSYWKVRLCAPVTRGSISGLWGSLMSSDMRYNASGGLVFRQIQVSVEPRCWVGVSKDGAVGRVVSKQRGASDAKRRTGAP